MTNEMKLLRKFIEAEGYQIKEIKGKTVSLSGLTGETTFDYELTRRPRPQPTNWTM